MIRLIASDLDGTLIPEGTQDINPRLIPLLKRLLDKNVHFVVASGREYENQLYLFDEIKDRLSYIAQNGARCVHQGKVIASSPIAPELVHRILRELEATNHGRFEVILSTAEGCYIEQTNTKFFGIFDGILPLHKMDSLFDVTTPVLKISLGNLVDDPTIMEPYTQKMQEIIGDEIRVVTAGNEWIDFICPEVNKANALRQLLNILDIKPEECIAFGDQNNDLEMLELVGTGYAMKGATPNVLASADQVIDSVEDVLEELLEGGLV